MADKKNTPKQKRQSTIADRRSIDNRRQVHSLDYFSKGGVERRKKKDRRQRRRDRRKGWVRISDWSSIYIDPDKKPDED